MSVEITCAHQASAKIWFYCAKRLQSLTIELLLTIINTPPRRSHLGKSNHHLPKTPTKTCDRHFIHPGNLSCWSTISHTSRTFTYRTFSSQIYRVSCSSASPYVTSSVGRHSLSITMGIRYWLNLSRWPCASTHAWKCVRTESMDAPLNSTASSMIVKLWRAHSSSYFAVSPFMDSSGEMLSAKNSFFTQASRCLMTVRKCASDSAE